MPVVLLQVVLACRSRLSLSPQQLRGEGRTVQRPQELCSISTAPTQVIDPREAWAGCKCWESALGQMRWRLRYARAICQTSVTAPSTTSCAYTGLHVMRGMAFSPSAMKDGRCMYNCMFMRDIESNGVCVACTSAVCSLLSAELCGKLGGEWQLHWGMQRWFWCPTREMRCHR